MSELQISAFLHCALCTTEWQRFFSNRLSPKDFARIKVGYTKYGFQIWCTRHEANLMHIDFNGTRNPGASAGYPILIEGDRDREIPNTDCIGMSPICNGEGEHRIQAGWTRKGLQAWCWEHNQELVNIDFEGRRFHANTTRRAT